MSKNKIRSSANGTCHWWMQRKTAIIMIPLVIWFAVVINSFLFDPELVMNTLLYSPLRFFCFLILINISIFHGMLGMKEICEDYIHNNAYKFITIFLITCLSWMTMLAVSLVLLFNFVINV